MKKAILVAEDDATARTLLVDMFGEIAGWVVTAVEDGAKALAVLETLQPDLIVLDVNMPGLDGISVYRQLRERRGMSEIPVLFVTGEQRPRRDDLDGAYRWLAKPWNVTDLLSAAAELLGTDPADVVG